MKHLIAFIFMFSLLSFGLRAERKEQVIYDRMEYIYNLKSLIDESIWKNFAYKAYDVPLVYYTDSACYVANPTSKFINLYNPHPVFENKGLKIYKTSLLDSIPFHMSTSITLGDSSSEYNYRAPFMNAASFEITRNTIPDVNCTEQWITMIIHEYFHGFQYKHPTYLNYYEQHVVGIPEDSLKRIYKSNKWFWESINKENDLLLSAINSTNGEKTKELIAAFFHEREQRRLLTKQRLHFEIKTAEQAYETMEGTARYVEYNLYRRFAVMNPDCKLAKSDSSYHAYRYFKNYKIENDPWLYLTNKTTYFYATGFNMARLLDKLKIEYKSRLFNESGLSLEQVLKESGLK